jgi:cytosolic 5'-nucleotidase 3
MLSNIPNSLILAKYPNSIQSKLDQFITDGPSTLKVVSDFDYTITTFYSNPAEKIRGLGCHSLLEESEEFHPQLREQSRILMEKYYPIEIDVHITQEEKAQHMHDWTMQSHGLLVQSHLHKSSLVNIVQDGAKQLKYRIRSNFDSFIDILKLFSIPMLIFSAGIADVLEECLHHYLSNNPGYDYDFHVISNRCIFDGKGYLQAFEEPSVHILNKHAKSFTSSRDYFNQEIEDRCSNALLVGDSPSDINMVDGMKYDNCIKVGYLNDKLDERLELYLDLYDLVVIGDNSGYELPLAILQLVCRSSDQVSLSANTSHESLEE